MKTAVSLPDDVFSGAEALARRMKLSRSELYKRALGEYLSRHSPDAVTEALDRVCGEIAGTDENGFAQKASRRVLERMQW